VTIKGENKMSDLISRESLKQRINLNYNSHQYIDAQSVKDIIYTEPTVEDKTVKELEKIKEEIQGLIDFEEDCCSNATLGYECLGVIKNKISELKGENNANSNL
jgi:hypothetical protein